MRWLNVLIALRDWTATDPEFLPFIIGENAKPGVGIGFPGAARGPCVWYTRHPQGERSIPLNTPECLPGALLINAELWAPVGSVPDMTEEAKFLAAHTSLSEFEDAWLACMRRFFSPSRKLSDILGGYYAATISQAIPLAGGSIVGQMGSLYTIALNEKE